MPFFLTVFAGLLVWIFYGVIRMAIDPKYRKEQETQAWKGKSESFSEKYYRERFNYWYDYSYKVIFGLAKHNERCQYAHRKAMQDLKRISR